jgi:DNA-binding PadR family transcriptional regulator
MPTATVDDIWLYVHEHAAVRTKDLEQEFVKTKRISRGTLYKYKRLLEAEGKIQAKSVQGRPPHNVYFIPENYRKHVEALKRYKQLPLKFFEGHIQQMEWQDTPEGFYLTPVKEKIIWQNPDTGAVFGIMKFPPGLSDAPHIHPDANVMGYVLSGEAERPDGSREQLTGYFNFRPKGTLDHGYKFSHETIIIGYWDGPRTKIDVDVPQDT